MEDAVDCRGRLRVGREVRREVVRDLCGRGKELAPPRLLSLILSIRCHRPPARRRALEVDGGG
eukprot:6756644-Pyramimonas_sp.AAC.1